MPGARQGRQGRSKRGPEASGRSQQSYVACWSETKDRSKTIEDTPPRRDATKGNSTPKTSKLGPLCQTQARRESPHPPDLGDGLPNYSLKVRVRAKSAAAVAAFTSASLACKGGILRTLRHHGSHGTSRNTTLYTYRVPVCMHPDTVLNGLSGSRACVRALAACNGRYTAVTLTR